MNFGKIALNQSIKTMLNYAMWIQIVLLFRSKTEDFYKDIADDVKQWFGTSNYNEDDKRPLLSAMNK